MYMSVLERVLAQLGHWQASRRSVSAAPPAYSLPVANGWGCSVLLLLSCAVGAAPRRREVLGLILVKELILWDHSTRTEVGRLKMRSMPLLRADTRLYDMLRLFETCRCHMALLARRPQSSHGLESALPGADR